METLKGADVVAALYDKMQLELMKFEGFQPHLAIVRVGEKPDDISYEKGAKKRMEKVGVRCSTYELPGDISWEQFKEAFLFINADEDIDGILLLRPLPKQLDEKLVMEMIDPDKDVDGISPVNMAKVFSGDDTGFAPCTAEAVMEMLNYQKVDLTGKRVVILGRSLVVGKPLAMLMMKKNATVTVCHTKTINPEEVCSKAEILVAACGKAKMVNASYVGNDAMVIDVGINVDAQGNLCGDVDLADISDVASVATPVPGGVGTVTTSVLAMHVIKAAKLRRKKQQTAERFDDDTCPEDEIAD